MLLSLASWRCWSSRAGKRCLRRQLLQHVLGGALFARRASSAVTGSFSSSKSTWRSCGPELMLNVRPASCVDPRSSIAAIRSANSRESCRSRADVDR